MAEFKKSDAIDIAHSIRMMIDAFVDEGFNEEKAQDAAMNMFIAAYGRATNVKMF